MTDRSIWEARPPEYDAELEVCGELYFFSRTMSLLKRIEQRFGALVPLMQRLEAFAVTQGELGSIVTEMLRNCGEEVPSKAAIQHWIWETGTPKVCQPLAKIVGELLIGNETLRAHEAARIAAIEEQTGNPTRPPVRAERTI